jgi:type IV secretion system protein VirB11
MNEEAKKANDLDARRLAALRYALGPVVLAALDDPNVVEVMLNDDGKLWIESLGKMTHADDISADKAIDILNQVSSSLNGEISQRNPLVEGELPLNGERFEGIAPPVVERGIFAIRKKAGKIFPLADYVRTGVLSFAQSELLRTAISNRQNILVVGGTGSGKTTFCNALLNELAILVPDNRMLLLEDTRELQCSLNNRVFLRATEWTDMARLSMAVNRLRPDSITVGEVRSGGPALALLKLWNTGHPGGLATVHANSAYKGLTRMDQLIQEVSANPQRVLIGEAVNVVVFLERNHGSRSVKEIVRVLEYDQISQQFVVENIQ